MAHNNYYLDLTAETYVVNDGAVLLRLHEKYGLWVGPGGHIDAGQDANEAAMREVMEEVGLKVTLIGPLGWKQENTDTNKDLVPPIFMNRHRINDIHEHSSLIFAGQSESREIVPGDNEDITAECCWVTRDELQRMKDEDPRLRPEIYKYAKKALELVRVLDFKDVAE